MNAHATLQKVLLTYDDYLLFPDDGKRYELIEGEVYVSPSPLTIHQRISRNLEFILHAHTREKKLGQIYDAPVAVIFGPHNVVEPDLIFISREREALIQRRGIEGAPDLVVEILSKFNRHVDRGVKKELYARQSVPHYWIVDPEAKTLEEFVLEDSVYVLRNKHVYPNTFTAALFADLPINLVQVFDE